MVLSSLTSASRMDGYDKVLAASTADPVWSPGQGQSRMI